MSRGLAFLYSLEQAKDYAERCEIVTRRLALPKTCRLDYAFIDMLDYYEDETPPWEDERNTEWEYENYIVEKTPEELVEDLDEGPSRSWYQALRSEDLTLVDRTFNMPFRWRAYVTWDYDRITAQDLLECGDYQSTHRVERERQFFGPEDEPIMKKSWDERSRIWKKGGRGYWSEGDESKIVWELV
jgi:hypothetical protein